MEIQVHCIRWWIFVTRAETARSRSFQSRAVVAKVWVFVHHATWVAIGIPGHTYFSHMTIASMTWIMGMAIVK